MSHINYSSEYILNSKLFKDIKAIHDADVLGGGSVLTVFLNEQGINLATDALNVTAADAAHLKGGEFEKLGEELSEKRDVLIDPAFKQHRILVQYLKGVKRGKVHELGQWGVTVDGEDRISYPSDFPGVKKCVEDFINKHNSLPVGTSPLEVYLGEHPEVDLVATLANVALAETHHDAFVQANKDKEAQFELRDNKFEPVYQHILGIGQHLMNTYPDTPHKLGRWGFNVDNAKAKEVQRVITVKQSAMKTIYNAVQGSKLVNKGNVPVNIYPGKTTDGTPFTLGAGETFTIKFRFGTFTVKNDSLTDSTDLSAITYHN